MKAWLARQAFKISVALASLIPVVDQIDILLAGWWLADIADDLLTVILAAAIVWVVRVQQRYYEAQIRS